MRYSCRVHWAMLSGLLAAALASPKPSRADVDENGFAVDWLVYGPLATAAGCCPDGVAGRLDYLSDGGSFTESTILPEDGLDLLPDFNGAAASTDFHAVLQGQIPVWMKHNTIDPAGDGSIVNANPDTVDFNLIYGPGFDSTNQGCPAPAENAVAFAVCYVKNSSGSPQEAVLQIASDDSIQVKLNDCELLYMSIGRGFGAANQIQNSVAVTIPTGSHRLFVKIFNGCGGFGFRLRLTDARTGGPLALDYGLDPKAFQVPEIEPEIVALDVSHTATPDRAFGLDIPVHVTIAATKVDPSLPDDTQVTLRETLFPGTSLIAGSATPAPTSQDGQTLTWKISAGDLTTTGIVFDFRFADLPCGQDSISGCVAGEYNVAGSACTYRLTGSACSVAVPLNAIFLGDIIGGGDGTGSKDPAICGVRVDTGLLLACDLLAAENHHTNDSLDPDAVNPQPETEAQYVDTVFFMSATTMPINTKGVEFTFEADDINLQDGGQPSTWNHILANITHDIDKGVGGIVCGGKGPFATGVAVHASAGVTINLGALRTDYGPNKVKTLTSLVGIDGCAGDIRVYIIYSTDTAILDAFTWTRTFGAGQAEPYSQEIPAEAKYVTFATGTHGVNADGTGADGCDHGVWAEARIFPEAPTAVISANPETGPAPLAVNFNGGGSTAPGGQTLSCFTWDFGDGSTGSGANTSHTYQSPGKYTVSLNVQSNTGLVGSARKDIIATFRCDNVAPYTSSDVGTPAKAGCGHFDGPCLSVFGSGKDIATNNDAFQFIYKSKTGDETVTANVTSVAFDPAIKGRAGIMMRDGTAPDAAFAYMYFTPQGANLKASFASRAKTGDNVVNKTSPNVSLSPGAAYLRLERQGSNFTGSTSPDGVTFTPFITVALTSPPAAMNAGFAVTSRDTNDEGKGAAVTFCNISFSDETAAENCTNGVDDDGDSNIDCADSDCVGNPSCTGGKLFHRGDADNNGSLQLTDAVRILGFLFLGQAAPTCLDAGDADDNGVLQLTDAVRILGFLFLGQAPPAPPGPPDQPCGSDVNLEDPDLGCDTYNC